MKAIRSVFAVILALCLFLSGCVYDDPGNISDTTGTSIATTTVETTHETTLPVHIHSFSSATCTTPKTCTDCGTTEGEAWGHSWKNATCTDPQKCTVCGHAEGSASGHSWTAATCTAPKTCSACGATSGAAAAHYYSGGKCTSCGKSDPNRPSEAKVWIPTKGGTKYHTRANCSNMIDPEQVTKAEAELKGFTPCKRCH